MTTIQRLKRDVLKRFPEASVEEEHFPSGNTWIDIRFHGTLFVVEHKPGQGYGISQVRHQPGLAGFGEGPDRLFSRYLDAQRHLLKLMGASLNSRSLVGSRSGRLVGGKK
jgi:hypothetical protein